MVMDVDIAVVGAGPAGLCFARAMAGSGLTVTLIEPQPLAALADPAFDGREIALTHESRRIMEDLDLWPRIDAAEISPLRDARVMDGPSLFALNIKASTVGQDQLGFLVPNHLIRRAAFDAVRDSACATILDGRKVVGLERLGAAGTRLDLDDGTTLQARLVVAADSRFSATREMLGIGATRRDFGRTMLVCRMAHEKPHEHIAWEWFGYGQTLALLPLNGAQGDGLQASAVLTLPPERMAKVAAMDEDEFNAEMTRRFDGRLGAMRLVSTRHSYPLVGVFAKSFAVPGAALVGDAAVGMHPVTAHGFNFGLQSAERLSMRIRKSAAIGLDIADGNMLAEYDRVHRLATAPLYEATNMIAGIFTDETLPAVALRKTMLRVANGLAPVKKAIAAHLTQSVA
ncbi:5-demethoxyubiquinol-8 5-hydroxylase UbiM [Zavarzinia compransoris]|uniref:5-demethoxyubiquinol-8 5-hydroxylase UbiM n=1 Tax=Zavarzinia marina TaxID=2911065 RepID=UPI001EEC02C0|nr:5-demethoxyubiquinol-8 5-hydroxylase UbiM [Zavarzinia marina]MCF4165058.1 5-demethoxyubiquinol-8 5-hydroxylase UbiM [Zavarzinia marina]